MRVGNEKIVQNLGLITEVKVQEMSLKMKAKKDSSGKLREQSALLIWASGSIWLVLYLASLSFLQMFSVAKRATARQLNSKHWLNSWDHPHALSSRWTQTRFDFFSDQRFWSSKFDNLRHLVFQSIFLPVESGVVRHSNTQIHLDKVNEFKIDTKSTVTLLSLFDEMSHQEQWATSLPNSQPSSLMSFYRQNKPASFALCVVLFTWVLWILSICV